MAVLPDIVFCVCSCPSAKALRPGQLPREIYTYLNPRKQVSYYFDASAANKESPKP